MGYTFLAMVLNFVLEVITNGKIPTVRVKGEIDIYSCPRLNSAFSEILQKGYKQFILNLENIQYLDSTGLGTIAHIARTLYEQEGVLFLVCSKPQIRKIFEISGLNKKNILLFHEENEVFQSISPQ